MGFMSILGSDIFIKNLPMHTYWELLPLEKLPTKHVHILANQTFFNTYAPT